LHELNETLEQRVAERSAVLSETEERLRQSQKMEAVGQLTGGVAHDFDNLLTIIRASTDLLRRPNLSEPRRARYLDAVAITVDRAAKQTNQLLAFARRQTLKPEVFDAVERIRAVADMLDTVTGSRIDVVVELPEGSWRVSADVSQFETALVNMAVNARDAMDGEGRITLRLVPDVALPPIRGHAGGGRPFLALSMADTGTGMTAATVSHVFEPFFTTKAVGKGTGLGLSQVFGFAKQSGGDIDVWSEPGRGTVFTLYLPQVEDAPTQDGPPVDETGPLPAGKGRHVLMVEDNMEVGRFVTQLIEDLGYVTTWTVNAAEALDRLARSDVRYDVVFSDVVIPGMSGLDLARSIRRRRPDLPVVLTTGYSQVMTQDGTDGFELLRKPYSAAQLSRILHRASTRRPAS
jgi:nitrogen-specific signal transduction histidine kinase